jgi:hypothetical protein
VEKDVSFLEMNIPSNRYSLYGANAVVAMLGNMGTDITVIGQPDELASTEFCSYYRLANSLLPSVHPPGDT